MKMNLLAACLAATATAALAHGGVENPAVLARMDSMKTISEQMKTLSETVKKQREFDADALNAAIAVIETESGKTVSLFEAEESDPKSAALPTIWEDFDDFSEKADALTQAAAKWSGNIVSEDDTPMALVDLGTTCKSCHDDYRD
ncbi:c-type cytochrome [Celeribacter litoreus]|uniref:c-type cytochrome n=1 Tax=Celeribacter litoreus TaxID=2876714 RepID=UPI001CCB540E|nr:cytochrome c [Celeribacter litoreus]MCA0043127.1 cytochrome c [Celeribacter litoreus]